MPINVHYCGKIVDYSTPKNVIHKNDIYIDKKRSFVYTGKQEIKITDAIFFALENPINHLYFVTLTYQWKPNINYGLTFRKKANTHLNRFKKYCRDKLNIRRYVGVLELTKRGVPHYHIIMDVNVKITSHKIINKKNVYLENAKSKDKAIASHEVRSGINFLVQSVASDINLLGGIDMQKYIVKSGMDAKIFALVHDSILAEVREDLVDEYSEYRVKSCSGSGHCNTCVNHIAIKGKLIEKKNLKAKFLAS